MIRRPLILLFSIVLFLAAVAFLAYRPATVAGVDAKELASSLDGSANGTRARCEQVHDSTWRCALRGDGRAGNALYRVETHSFGCWKARIAQPTAHLPRRPSGCITVLDYL